MFFFSLSVDQRSSLFGEFNQQSTGIRLPTILNLPIDVLENNLQVGEGLGGIKNIDRNTQLSKSQIKFKQTKYLKKCLKTCK